MSDYHVLFSTDKNYLPYLFVTVQSILDSFADQEYNSHDCCIFHVLTDNTIEPQEFQAYVQAFVEFNSRVNQVKVAFKFEPHQVDASIFQGFTVMERGNWQAFSTYYRLLFAQVIPADIPRILYLDIDLLIRADIRELFSQADLEQKIMCVGITPRAILRSKNPFDPIPCLELTPKKPDDVQPLKIPVRDCISAGVMLINLEQWRAQNIEQKCLDIGAKWELPLFDQDILSVACQGKIAYMDWDWNMQFSQFKLKELTGWFIQDKFVPFAELPLVEGAPTFAQFQDMCLHPKIVHFTEVKPWNFPATINEQEYEWLKDQIGYIGQWIDIRNKLQPFFEQVQSALSLLGEQGISLATFDHSYNQRPTKKLLMRPIFNSPSLSALDMTYNLV